MTSFPRGRGVVMALVATLLFGACAATPDALGPTINLNPSGSATPSAPATSSADPSAPPTLPPASSSAPSAPTSAAPSTPTPSLSPRPSPTVGATGAPTLPPVSALDWRACGDPFECATLQVPLDYANPAGKQIPLALIRLPAADPSRRIGSMLMNPGGPGASGVDFLRSSGQTVFTETLRDRFDIVGFDPRGVGASDPVTCLNGSAMDRLNALDPTPDDKAESDALIAGAHEFADSCQRNSGELLPHVATADAARDMDRIREALGEAKLTYFGFSYGTFLGTVYAGLFPDHVRALVLDGAIDPNQALEERLATQAKGFDDALDAFLAQCKTDVTCAFHNDGHPSEAYDALMAKIDADPLPATVMQDPRPVGPGEAFIGVLFALYARDSWPTLAQALDMAQGGDGSLLLAMSDAYNDRQPDGTYSNEAAANNAVNCTDYKVPTDPAAYEAMVPDLQKVAPRFGQAIAYMALTCAFWPVQPTHDPGVIRADGAPPILVVGTTNDPATPYLWAQNLAKELASGVLLTRRGEGHTGYAFSSCIQQHVDQYLVSLKTPEPGTICGT